jgi:hypothetical protein
MEEFDKDQVLQWYGWLEEELLDILKYIPPSGQNLKAFSPRLASVIIESCGLLDSILRQVSTDPAIVDGKSKRRDDLKIKDYAKLYASKFNLSSSKSILLITPARYLTPFSAWGGSLFGDKYQSPSWWQTHNDLKHDRIANLRKAKLEVAIESLAGLQLVIATLPDFARAVLRGGWVPGKKTSPQITIEILASKPGSGHDSLLVESRFFIVARGQETFPDKIEDFHPAVFAASERVFDFFGRGY